MSVCFKHETSAPEYWRADPNFLSRNLRGVLGMFYGNVFHLHDDGHNLSVTDRPAELQALNAQSRGLPGIKSELFPKIQRGQNLSLSCAKALKCS